jgi:hypothetical protein
MMKRLLACCAALWLTGLVLGPPFTSDARAIERAGTWSPYRDRESGVQFDFPSHLFPQKSAGQERSGSTFSTADGRARLRVFSRANAANETPRAYLRRVARTEEADFTYIRTADRFFVASGTRDGVIFYRRCNFSSADRRIGCLHLDYPQREKRAWDDTVTRISRTMRLVDSD